ncbi:MAG: serine hydrolase domain-containing protein [Gammaproteobacteria bacterium]
MILGLLLLMTRVGFAADPDPKALRQVLESYRLQHDMPALAAGIAMDGELVAASVVGVRRSDRLNKARQGDRFHIGSIAKSFTATLTGIMVDGRILRWDERLGTLFPKAVMSSAYGDVTVTQLLTHLSGMPYQPGTPEAETDRFGPSLYEKRRGYVLAALKDKPAATPGTKFIYGGGQILVANAIEQRLRKPFEALLKREIFTPLRLRTARFGDPAGDKPNQGPWAHVKQSGKLKPIAPDISQDLQARSPVGRNLSMSIGDLTRFAAEHVRGTRGDRGMMSGESWRQLHTPVAPGHHAPAWAVGATPWARGVVLYHAGSDLKNFALCHLVPRENYAICTATNVWYKGVHAHHDAIHARLAGLIHEGAFDP